MSNVLSLPPERPRPIRRRTVRPWREKLRDAARGMKLGVRGHSSFFVHFFCGALVIAAAATLQCSLIEWALLCGCIGGVLTVELINSAIETLFHGLEESTRHRLANVLDIAAGGVLCAGLTAAGIGGIILGNRLWLALS
jgi:diacylglycerol kinase